MRTGAEPLDFTRDFAWMSPCGWYVRFPGDLLMLGCTRDLIDWGVRARVAALPNVRIQQGADVAGLIRGPGGARVAGVRLRSRTADDEVDYRGTELAAEQVLANVVVEGEPPVAVMPPAASRLASYGSCAEDVAAWAIARQCPQPVSP
jgi:hypothetical protein